MVFAMLARETPSLAAPGETTRESISTAGAEGNDVSQDPKISRDGR